MQLKFVELGWVILRGAGGDENFKDYFYVVLGCIILLEYKRNRYEIYWYGRNILFMYLNVVYLYEIVYIQF